MIKNSNFDVFIQGFCSSEDDLLFMRSWCANLWGPTSTSTPSAAQAHQPPEHLRVACRQVEKVVETAALSVCHSLPDLAEFFFNLPRVNRDVMEYLGVCFVKLDLMSRRGASVTDSSSIDESMPVLQSLAETFAPHVLKPGTWGRIDAGQRAQRKRLQILFFQIFLFFVKRKHNLMTSAERGSLMENEGEALNRLLIEMAAAPAKFSKAFDRAIDGTDSEGDARSTGGGGGGNNTNEPYNHRRPSSMSPHGHTRSPTSPISPISDGALLSPPVMRHMNDTMVEVRFDFNEVAGPQDTWSNYSMDSDNEDSSYAYGAGLSPDASPAPARKAIGNAVAAAVAAVSPAETAAAVVAAAEAKFGSDADDLLSTAHLDDVAGGSSTFRSGLTVCSWERSEEEIEAEKTLLTGAPNLGRWLNEFFLPFDVEAQNDFFVLEAVKDSAAFDAGNDPSNGPDSPAELVKPPGTGIIDLLGADFEPCNDPSGLAWERFDLHHGHRHSSWSPPKSVSALSPTTPTQRGTPKPQAINYDYAMAFPRTHADVPAHPQATNVVSRFLSYPHGVAKCDYDWDVEYGLLNHALPKYADTKSVEECENCHKPITSVFGMSSNTQRTHCRYCARLMCRKCCDRKFVVPSYVVVKGDFQVHTICQPCENHLQKLLHTPCIEFNRMSKAAIKAIGKARIETIKSIREEGLRLLYYHILPNCPARHTMISLIPQNCTPYLAVFPDSVGARLSLADLCELQTQYVAVVALCVAGSQSISFQVHFD